ncbi:hypothetical protein [Streptomyces sp. SP18CS02]|uniref:hypothetical protein n=1 Tax=Streptomyces sp. SP18CS02 TaxID=3002531 RepID=UPI002E7A1CE6|nr:hypothetical protein [Streptomyces sp. SP18CS02]MEE1752772.1 hypothetical protein [Streptomyces sp. SP18CS02]
MASSADVDVDANANADVDADVDADADADCAVAVMTAPPATSAAIAMDIVIRVGSMLIPLWGRGHGGTWACLIARVVRSRKLDPTSYLRSRIVYYVGHER